MYFWQGTTPQFCRSEMSSFYTQQNETQGGSHLVKASPSTWEQQLDFSSLPPSTFPTSTPEVPVTHGQQPGLWFKRQHSAGKLLSQLRTFKANPAIKEESRLAKLRRPNKGAEPERPA